MKKMMLLLLFAYSFLYADTIQLDSYIEDTEISIGTHIHIKMSIPKKENPMILKELLHLTQPFVMVNYEEIIHKAEIELNLHITSFESGDFDNIIIKLPVVFENGEKSTFTMLLNDIKVNDVFSDEEKKLILESKGNNSIEINGLKDIFKFRFYVGTLLSLGILIMLGGILLFLFLYYLVKRKNKKKQNLDTEEQLSPFEKFNVELEMLVIDPNNRIDTEYKVSMLSEIFKEFIFSRFNFNAPSETTKEFLISLRTQQFESKIIAQIHELFTTLDLIKFAKASITTEDFSSFKKEIKVLGEYCNSMIGEGEDDV